MIVALTITWLFWGAPIGLLIWWRRSWAPMILFPVLLSFLLWSVAWWSSVAAMALSGVIHVMFLLKLIVVSVRDRRESDDPFFMRPNG